MKKDNLSPLERLTGLQKELGYKEGELSTVAMLGLVGEAGEVFDEMVFTNVGMYSELNKYAERTSYMCCKMDDYKKLIRKEVDDWKPKSVILDEKKFDAELADVSYYLNILAMNRGLTIEQLAQMAHDKIRSKQAAGGSSEDKKS